LIFVLPASHIFTKIFVLCSELGLTIVLQEEMIANLGTIARSGSKAFMQQVKEAGKVEAKDIIGQFGVGFYSAFMVANRIEVFSRSSQPGNRWFLIFY
jgi:HSP90 family molecular chaperone